MRKLEEEKEKLIGKQKEDVEMKIIGKRDTDQDDVSIQTTTRMNFREQTNDTEVDFVQKLNKFHGRKFSK